MELASPNDLNFWLAALITAAFSGFAWLIRGVTRSGAAAGFLVCFALILGAGWGGFGALCAVFFITWIATRIGRPRKQRLGTAESRTGRTALQVFANVGVAAICALLFRRFHHPLWLIGAAAALVEAAADTVSSEIGQAVDGTPRLVTTWKLVAVGTNGAITLVGTVAGIAAALLVAIAAFLGRMISLRGVLIATLAGVLGMFIDSLLGATVEGDGRLNNNAVNFLSTLSAALLSALLTHVLD
jgi:uncharacterized protein (TIGR00297 family)